MLGKVRFESLGKLTPGKQNAPAAAFALEADIRAKTRDNPFKGTTRMLFPKTEMIVQAQIW
jgi:hypothetical protein